MKSQAFIFDIDGTIADCSHRLPLLYDDVASLKWKEQPQWAEFHTACVNDAPIRPVIELLQILIHAGYYEPIFVTGRPESSRPATAIWLWQNTGIFVDKDNLFMRADSDRRQDYEYKKDVYNFFIKDKYDVLGVFEDRQQCVDMWRKLGLTCYQVDKGDY